MDKQDPKVIVEEFLKNAELLYNMGQFSEMAELCREFLKVYEDDRIYSALSSAEYSLGDMVLAEKSARRGLELNPESTDNILNLAFILLEKGLYSNALRMFIRAKRTGEKEITDICNQEIQSIEKRIGKTSNELMPRKANRRVLIIAAIFPPESGSGVQRTVKLVKYLRLFGWEPVVITIPKSSKPSFSGFKYFDEFPDDIEVIRVPIKKSFTIAELQNIKEKLTFMLSAKTRIEFNDIYSSMDAQNQLALCSFPEPVVFWAYEVAESIEKYVDMDNIDAVYSTSGPYSDHFAGYYIKHRFHKPWFADFRDEWSNNPAIWSDKSTLTYKMCLDCEHTIINAADQIICVTEKSYENYLDLGVLANKLSCITNGYDEEDFEGIPKVSEKNKKFTLVHNGLLYLDRAPRTLLIALKNLIKRNDIEISSIIFQIGSYPEKSYNDKLNAEINQLGLSEVAFVTPYMEHGESLKLAAAADLLILLLGPSDTYVATYPAKIFEYLRLGKPILSLGPKGSVIESLLNKTEHGANIDFNDLNAIEAEILRIYRRWKAKEDNFQNKITDISKYERHNLVRKHAALFENAISTSRVGVQTDENTFFGFLLNEGNYQKTFSIISDAISKYEFQKAAKYAEQWIDHGTNLDGRLYLYYGIALNMIEKYNQALMAHKRAIELTPIFANLKGGNSAIEASRQYDEYDSNCIGCGSDIVKQIFVCNQSISANNYGVLNPIRTWRRCEDCGLVYAGNMPSGAALGKYYAEHFKEAQLGGQVHAISEVGDYNNYLKYSKKRIGKIGDILKRPGSLLDIGAGIGTFVMVANSCGWQADGIESTPENVTYANKKWGLELMKIDFFDFTPMRVYDAITMFEVIEHLVAPWDAIKKCSSLLSQGGVLVIATPFRDSEYVKSRTMLNDFWWNEPSHLTYMDTQSLINRAKKYGLECINVVESEQGQGRLEVYLRKER